MCSIPKIHWRREMSRRPTDKHSINVFGTVVTAAAVSLATPLASANEELARLSQIDENWVMQCKDYACTHSSPMTDINSDNVQKLKPAWSFSTGVLHGHE